MKLLNIREASNLLQIHPNTILKLCRKGDLPSFKVGKSWRINQDLIYSKFEEVLEKLV